jgi:GNAT superfamily N-acetyltransferase
MNAHLSIAGIPSLIPNLAQFARQNDRNGIARAYVMVPAETGNPVVGYYTLANSAVAFNNLPTSARKRLPKYPLPSVRIGELAVEHDHQGEGLGSILMIDALKHILNVSSKVAVKAVVVDPIDQRAASFYQHYGFESLRDSETLFLTLKDIRSWFEPGD